MTKAKEFLHNISKNGCFIYKALFFFEHRKKLIQKTFKNTKLAE